LDEVQTGFGRTGKWFAFEHWGVVPDILTVGKALGGGMPLGGFLARREVMRSFAENPPLCHVTTFGGHPVCCAAALAALEVMERENLPERAEKMGAKLKSALQQLATRYPLIAAVRGKGLMLGLEFITKEATQKFVRECLRRGLIVGGTLHTEKVVRIAPPLVITDEEIAFALSVMEEALQAVS
jgi:4-aminobutyrate aminotransferase-like enzyme